MVLERPAISEDLSRVGAAAQRSPGGRKVGYTEAAATGQRKRQQSFLGCGRASALIVPARGRLLGEVVGSSGCGCVVQPLLKGSWLCPYGAGICQGLSAWQTAARFHPMFQPGPGLLCIHESCPGGVKTVRLSCAGLD